MRLTPDEIAVKTSFLSELLLCSERISISTYNVSGSLIDTNATNVIYDTILRYSNRLQDAVVFGENSDKPVILTMDTGLLWSVVFEKDELDQLQSLHVMGPVFSAAPSKEAIDQIKKRPNMRVKWIPKLLAYLKDVPVVPATNFFKYTLMLNYAVNDAFLKPSDITFLDFNEAASKESSENIDYAKFYALESQMATFVRTGDIHYKGKIASAASIMSELQPLDNSNTETAKQLATSFCVLCMRSAIEGGILPDTVYTKGTVYLNNLAVAASFANVISICHTVFEDFLFQVHNKKQIPQYSPEIERCLEYIETHPDEKLTLEMLAHKTGYTDYYLSKKFASEVGISINNYIKKIRIGHAQYLMATTHMSIQEISDFLHFGNRNFFAKTFKDVTGITPAAFKKAHTH